MISSFSAEEVESMKKWMEFSLGNTQLHCQNLFALLAPHIKAGTVPDEQNLWSSLFPGEPYRDDRFRHIVEELTRVCESFLVWREVQCSPALYQRLLVASLSNRVDTHTFDKLWRRFHHKTTPKEGSSDWIKELFESSVIRLAVAQRESGKKAKISLLSRIEESHQALDQWYLFQKANLSLSRASVGFISLPQLATELQLLFDTLPLSALPVWMGLYFDMIRLATGDPASSVTVGAKLRHWHPIIPQEIETALISLNYNYLVRSYNRDHHPDIREQLIEATILGIEEQVFHQQGYLPSLLLKNLLASVFQLKGFHEAKTTLSRFLPAINPSIRQETDAFHQGMFLFWSRNYQGAIVKFQTTSFSEEHHYIQAQLKTIHGFFYLASQKGLIGDQGYTNLSNRIKALQRTLRISQTISASARRRHLTHIKFLRKLIRQPQNDAREALRCAIEKETEVADKEWLLAQF